MFGLHIHLTSVEHCRSFCIWCGHARIVCIIYCSYRNVYIEFTCRKVDIDFRCSNVGIEFMTVKLIFPF